MFRRQTRLVLVLSMLASIFSSPVTASKQEGKIKEWYWKIEADRVLIATGAWDRTGSLIGECVKNGCYWSLGVDECDFSGKKDGWIQIYTKDRTPQDTHKGLKAINYDVQYSCVTKHRMAIHYLSKITFDMIKVMKYSTSFRLDVHYVEPGRFYSFSAPGMSEALEVVDLVAAGRFSDNDWSQDRIRHELEVSLGATSLRAKYWQDF